MPRRDIALILLGLFLTTNWLLGNDWLWVEDPRNPWRDGQGTIEEAVISLKPQGLYMEVGLYLTFSARGLNFSNQDTLEVQFFFELPGEATVNDLWLWVGEDIMRAQIMDRWTASSIYEDIVDRCRDPAILFKRDRRQYELRIFPMAGKETRKIKLTYLLPIQWLSESVTASLPANLLRTSRYPISESLLLFWPKSEWQNPRFLEFPDISFQFIENPEQGNYYQAAIPHEALSAGLNLALDTPMHEGVYISRYDQQGEGFYQLAFLPSRALELQVARKVVFLFDYEAHKSTVSADHVLNTFKSVLRQQFTASDSFNLIFSNLNMLSAGEQWFAGDAQGIEQAFSNVGANPLANYSNLPALLQEGIEFVQDHGNSGTLFLIANSDHMGDYTVANSLIRDVMAAMDPLLPIYIADFGNRNQAGYYFGGRSYRGNEYFYTNISRMTNGNYQNINAANSFSNLLDELFQILSGFLSSFDFHTTLQNGFCYGRFNLGPENQTTYLDRPILQVGRYVGSFPFVIEASGVYEFQPFFQRIEISENDLAFSSNLAEAIWTANYLLELEEGEQTNSIITEIIDYSLSERLLSLYTAFLALEPNDTLPPCFDCYDETVLTAIDHSGESAEDDSLLIAYPNPFNTTTTIEVKLSKKVAPDLKKVSFRIYNILGQLVRTFHADDFQNQREFHFSWNGRNDAGDPVASGTYFFTVNGISQRQVLKLLLVK